MNRKKVTLKTSVDRVNNFISPNQILQNIRETMELV